MPVGLNCAYLCFWRAHSNEPSRYQLIPEQFRSDALRRFVAEQAVAPPGDNGEGLARGDLIRPIGAVLKVIHCDHPDDKTGPKLEASFEVGGCRRRGLYGEREMLCSLL